MIVRIREDGKSFNLLLLFQNEPTLKFLKLAVHNDMIKGAKRSEN